MPTPTRKRQTVSNTLRTSLGKLSKQALEVLTENLAKGDTQAAITVIGYIIPKPKPSSQEIFQIKKDITGLTLPEKIAEINAAVLNGEVSLEAANTVFDIFIKAQAILESTQMEARIKALEDAACEPNITFKPNIEIRTEKGSH